jgi:hypothetical protein
MPMFQKPQNLVNIEPLTFDMGGKTFEINGVTRAQFKRILDLQDDPDQFIDALFAELCGPEAVDAANNEDIRVVGAIIKWITQELKSGMADAPEKN